MYVMMGTASRAVDTLSLAGCAPAGSGSEVCDAITPLATAHLPEGAREGGGTGVRVSRLRIICARPHAPNQQEGRAVRAA